MLVKGWEEVCVIAGWEGAGRAAQWNKRGRRCLYARVFSAAKDAITSRSAQAFINQRIGRYGEVRSLRLDSKNKSGEVVCLLHGEPEPITLRLEGYELRRSGGETFIRLGRFTCSRPWLENLLNDYGRDREVPVPGWAAAAL